MEVFKKSRYKILFYQYVKWGLVFFLTWLYYLSFKWHNPYFLLFMLLLFAYCVAGIVSLILHFFIYTFTKPLVLKEVPEIIRAGIPPRIKVVFFRPIFAKTTYEMGVLLTNMRKDILNTWEENKNNLKFIVIDNTRDTGVREWTRNEIKKLQNEFGDKTVFYFHRNPACDFFKKVGILQDALMLLYEGKTRPYNYQDKIWENWAKGTRNPTLPIWDEILGDVQALGLQGTLSDILNGKEIKVDRNCLINIAIVSDADNYWPKGQIRKLVAKIVHPENKDFIIWQPSIELTNPREDRFIQLCSWARRMYEFDPVAKWRLFIFNPFYGKGAIQVEGYVREVIKTEWLHPGKSASHDFQESLKAWCVLCEDVYIYEKSFSNKLSELLRVVQWDWGDLETVRRFLLKPFAPGRKTHLFVLLRRLIGIPIYELWLLGMILAWEWGRRGIVSLLTLDKPQILLPLFIGIPLISILIPKFLAPWVVKKKGKLYQDPVVEIDKSWLTIIKEGIIETFVSNLIHKLDLVYRPPAQVRNFLAQIRNKPFVWKTGAMGEMETARMKLGNFYSALKLSTFIGILLLLGCIFKIFSGIICFVLSIYIASFLLGPLAIYLTSKPVKNRSGSS
ncbi:MAG: hypothetical protein NC898_03550 [Candidatus Omnitrophica bacterium]|nr:hypothetical protein [Candidatus Omnitrophota bacterium]MCM8793527.1 hypothetical protein [Candidatus Omnitrophota bacterium]